jgi:hypothetical protein
MPPGLSGYSKERFLLRRVVRAEGARQSALALSAAATAASLIPRAALAIVRPDHIVVVIEEDRAANAIGAANMPYFNALANTGLLYANSHGIARPSQPNYLALFSGSTQSVTDNFPGYTYYATENNLAKSLNSASGLSFAGYAESLPSAGSQTQYATDVAVDPDAHPDIYFRAYNPMAQFTAVGPAKTNADISKPFSSFPTNFATLPTVSFVIPDNFHNTHGSNVAPYTGPSSDYDQLRHNADTWLQANIDPYLQWAKTNNSLLIVTEDEEDMNNHPENGITTIVNGDPRLFVPGVNLNRIDHYRTLRTILDMYGLVPLANTAGVSAFDSNAAGQLYAPPSNGTWIATAAGSTWGGLPNWSSGLPNAQGAVANFVTSVGVQHAVTVDGTRTMGAINLNDAAKYTLGGTGTIVIDVASGSGSINVTSGSHDITAALSLTKNTVFTVTGAGNTLKLTNILDSTVGLTKEDAGALSVNRIRSAALTINSGTVSILSPRSIASTSRIGNLIIAGQATPTATFDLGSNDLILDYTSNSPLPVVAAQIKSGYANGSWNGNGITSSAATSNAAHPTGLGYAEASALNLGTFSTQSVDNTTVLVRYTLLGDTNLDGVVNAIDFNALAAEFNRAGALWSDGDVNYDGRVNALDFNLLAANFGQPALSGPSLVPDPSCGSALGGAFLFFWMHRVAARSRGVAA